MSNEQGRRIDDKRSQEAVDWSEVLSSHPMPAQAAATEQAKLLQALRWALEWIDAVPSDTVLPAMPGFDRDYVNSLIGRAIPLATPADAGAGLTASELAGLAALADRIEEANEQPMVIARSAARVIDKLIARQSPAPVTADAGAAAPVSRDAVLEEAAEAVDNTSVQCDAGEWAIVSAAANVRALKSQPVAAAADQKVCAWMTEDGERVVSAATKEGQVRDGGASASAMRPYTVPLVRAGAAAAGEDARDAGWISVDERLPEPRQIVLVMSANWEFPAVLKYQIQPYQRFIDEVTGRWYWYPERMHWMPLPTLPPSPVESAKQGGSDA